MSTASAGKKRIITSGDRARQLATTPILSLFGMLIVFAVAAFISVNIDVDKDEVALDLQVLIKLGLSALYGVYGFVGAVTDNRVRRVLFSFPGFWMVMIAGFYFLSVMPALDPVYAFASSVTLSCVILGTVTALVQLGAITVMNAMFFGMSIYIVGGWIAYFLFPEIGVFDEPIVGGEYFQRMAGLAHPNTLGQYSGLALVVGVVLYISYQQRSLLRYILLISAAIALYMSLSRASLGATAIALLIGYRQFFLKRQYVPHYMFLFAAGLLGLVALSAMVNIPELVEQKMVSVSKSGDADEIVTATGRVDIWSYALRLIGESPMFGYGAASSKYLMRDYCMYTHNMVLNVMLSTGIFGGVTCLLMILFRLAKFWSRQHPLADALVAFIVLNGLVENVAFSTIAGMPTILWIAGLIWWQLDQPEARNPHSTEMQT